MGIEQPKQLETADLQKLRDVCQEYINFIDNDEEYHEDEEDHYANQVFETAMETVFGKDVWDFINNRRY